MLEIQKLRAPNIYTGKGLRLRKLVIMSNREKYADVKTQMTDFITQIKIFDEIFDNMIEIFSPYCQLFDILNKINKTPTANNLVFCPYCRIIETATTNSFLINIPLPTKIPSINILLINIPLPTKIPWLVDIYVKVSVTKTNPNFILAFINKIIVNTEVMLVLMEKGLNADPLKFQFWELQISKERLLYTTSYQYLKPKTLQTWELARANELYFQNSLFNIWQNFKPKVHYCQNSLSNIWQNFKSIMPTITVQEFKHPYIRYNTLEFPRTRDQIDRLVYDSQLNGTIFKLLSTVPPELKPLYTRSFLQQLSFERTIGIL